MTVLNTLDLMYAWHPWALCANSDMTFWDFHSSELPKIRRFCGGCPVQALCLGQGMRETGGGYDQQGVIYGGLTSAERRDLAKGRLVTDNTHQPPENRSRADWRRRAEAEALLLGIQLGTWP